MVSPEDFASDTPPPRIVSTECEYKTDSPLSTYEFLNEENRRRAGRRQKHEYDFNGARIYSDVQHIEYAAPESLGPEDAVVSDFAGILVTGGLVRAADKRKTALYRSTGSFMGDAATKNTTRGYHQNFLSIREASESNEFTHILPLFLATSTWAGQGTLTREGFVMAQKIWGIGGDEVSFGYKRRTDAHEKAMVAVRSKDDTVRGEWRRIEVISGDAGQSPVARLAAMGAISLLLRAIEHPEIRSEIDLSKLITKNRYGRVGQYFAKDTDVHKTTEILNGDKLSALDLQESLLGICEDMAQKIHLPADELKALALWRSIIDRLRKVNMPEGQFNGTERLLDNVALYAYLFKRFGPENIAMDNREVMAAVLFWDRIEPEGGATRWWSKNGFGIVDPKVLMERVHHPPRTRAARRVEQMKKPETIRVDWSTWKDKNDRAHSLGEAH